MKSFDHALPRPKHVLPAVMAALALSACAGKHPQQLPPPPPSSSSAAASSAQGYSGVQNVPIPGSQADFAASMMGRDTIHFAFDKYDIDAVSAESLQAQARWLRRYPNKRATIEGNCDERGTREYNLALGQRRAVAAKNYLIQLGIDPSRIDVISYGKERPIDPASNEEAWARNRRDVTVTID
jgi:peptidoglycan-associated lipoprotein